MWGKQAVLIIAFLKNRKCSPENCYLDGKPFAQEAFRKGRPKTKFASVGEEMAYLKAEIEYLKKRYPNLHGE